jgi:hypothetical protein
MAIRRRSTDDIEPPRPAARRGTKAKAKKKEDTPLSRAIAELRTYAESAMNEWAWTSYPSLRRALEIHPSGFPYCPIKTMYKMLQGELAPVGETSFATEYFTSIGTLVHTLIQTAMGLGGRVWGHWRCSQHGKRCTYESMDDITPYHECPICGSYCTYEEIGYNIEDVLIGHQDCLFELADGSFWVVDYKTCMLKKAEMHAADGLTLGKNNVYRAQQRTYVTLAHRKYGKSHGIKPRGWILMYLPRDNPFRPAFYGEEVTAEDKRLIWERIGHDIDAHTTILDATSFEEIAPLIDSKPCTSLSHYKEYMESPYEECPLVSVCFNRRQLRSLFKTELEGHVLLPLRHTIHRLIDEQNLIYRELADASAEEDD